MLHAIGKSKSGFYKRYLGERDDSLERKVCEEDEITSTILGPLDFLPTHDVGQFWRGILNNSGHLDFLPNIDPIDVQITFWDRRNASADGKPIEPDCIVKIKYPDGQTRLLLIELKWHSGLSGDDQLHLQWLQYLDETERDICLHLFIAPEISAGASALNNKEAGGDVWQSRLVLLPWIRVRSVLGMFASNNSGFGRWASFADQFLARVGIRKFSGFCDLGKEVHLSLVASAPFFWVSK